jgi:hypothetical protein
MLRRHLDEAERHVAQGERHIAEQEERVAKLARLGVDLTEARKLLDNLCEPGPAHPASGPHTCRVRQIELKRCRKVAGSGTIGTSVAALN